LGKKALVPLFTNVFNYCLQAGYCPQHFREGKTIALWKTGKEDYSVPKAY
jgi:hypothetical protein